MALVRTCYKPLSFEDDVRRYHKNLEQGINKRSGQTGEERKCKSGDKKSVDFFELAGSVVYYGDVNSLCNVGVFNEQNIYLGL